MSLEQLAFAVVVALLVGAHVGAWLQRKRDGVKYRAAMRKTAAYVGLLAMKGLNGHEIATCVQEATDEIFGDQHGGTP